jgi:hypothetical protein
MMVEGLSHAASEKTTGERSGQVLKMARAGGSTEVDDVVANYSEISITSVVLNWAMHIPATDKRAVGAVDAVDAVGGDRVGGLVDEPFVLFLRSWQGS